MSDYKEDEYYLINTNRKCGDDYTPDFRPLIKIIYVNDRHGFVAFRNLPVWSTDPLIDYCVNRHKIPFAEFEALSPIPCNEHREVAA